MRGSTWPHTILAAPLVAAQPLLDADRRLIGAGIGIGRKRIHLEYNPGIEMDDAFRAKAEPILADGGVAGKAAVEILGGSFRYPGGDARPQRLADVDVLARHAKRHHGLRSAGAADEAAAPHSSCASPHSIRGLIRAPIEKVFHSF